MEYLAATESAVNPWFVGLGVLALMLFLIVALFIFGKGQGHS